MARTFGTGVRDLQDVSSAMGGVNLTHFFYIKASSWSILPCHLNEWVKQSQRAWVKQAEVKQAG